MNFIQTVIIQVIQIIIKNITLLRSREYDKN